MILKQLTLGFIFGVSMSFISWIVGMVFNSLLMKTKYYERLSNLNFIESKVMNNLIGIKYFKWIVINTFFKFFNQNIKLPRKDTDLNRIRHEMTLAEISHLIGFLFVVIVSIYKSITVGVVFAFTMMIPNILMNLYPSLLQQENKRRIDKLIRRKIRTEDILNRIKKDFGQNSNEAIRILQKQLNKYEYLNQDRIIRCIVYLAKGSIPGLNHTINQAMQDPRDVILWAEYEGLTGKEELVWVRDFTKTFDHSEKNLKSKTIT